MLSRRLQVLIDEALPAVDRSLAIAAMERFLAAPPMPVDDWDVMKREMLEELYGERRE